MQYDLRLFLIAALIHITFAALSKRRKYKMNKTWLSVVIVVLFEVAWVIGLKHASGWL